MRDFIMKNLRFTLIGSLLVLMLLACSSASKRSTDNNVDKIDVLGITLEDINQFVAGCTHLLEKPMPEGFKLIAPDIYQAIDDSDFRIVVYINSRVIATSFSAAFSDAANANRLNELFHTYFENNNWERLEESNYDDNIFYKDGVFAAIDIKQEPRDDEHVVTHVLFTEDFAFFSENFIYKD